MISAVDKDGNGEIDFDEFIEMMSEKINSYEDEEQMIRETFKVFDKDGDGYIDAQELYQVMQSLDDEPLTQEDVCLSFP